MAGAGHSRSTEKLGRLTLVHAFRKLLGLRVNLVIHGEEPKSVGADGEEADDESTSRSSVTRLTSQTTRTITCEKN